jgi:hypothetical protein
VLQEQDKAIIPHIAEQEGRKFLYEVIFKYVCAGIGRPAAVYAQCIPAQTLACLAQP